MKITKSNLKNAIKNILAESSGLSTQMEMDIESQVRKSQRTPGGLFLEVPNDPQIIQGTRNFLRDRFGMDIKNIVEDPDGEYYIFYQPNLKESKETKAKITKRRLRRIIRESVKGSWLENN
jgi:F420-0:gamma-glutamyl ligase-like protein